MSPIVEPVGGRSCAIQVRTGEGGETRVPLTSSAVSSRTDPAPSGGSAGSGAVSDRITRD